MLSEPAPVRRVAVAPILSADPIFGLRAHSWSLDWPGVEVLPVGAEDLPGALAAARVARADALLAAAYASIEDGVHVTVRLLEPERGRVMWAASAGAGHSLTPAHLVTRLLRGFPKGERGAAPAALVAVLPPANETNDVQAPKHFASALASALIAKGYHPVSPSTAALNGLGVTDGGQLRHVEPARLAAALGADAFLFSSVEESGLKFSGWNAGLRARLVSPEGAVYWDSAGETTQWLLGGPGMPITLLYVGILEKALRLPVFTSGMARMAAKKLRKRIPGWPPERRAD